METPSPVANLASVCRLYEVMTKKGITQKDLKEITGNSQSHISQIVNGKDLYLSTAQEIAIAVIDHHFKLALSPICPPH
ncbi:helix-turn-helix transcriptional regulator [Desulfosporosinus sp.]|uniref:helix-turn-helix domain-containing protein n=1 Tax=Desulfosporosinus sp. TaxID=157907 RepID=UPI003447FB52